MGRIGTGVEARETSIRIKFVLDGETVKERLTQGGKSLAPTPANLKYANRIAADIKRRIAAGTFEYAEFFPDSPRAKVHTDTKTFGQIADLWLESKGQLMPGTLNSYKISLKRWKHLLGADTEVSKLTYQVLAAKIGGYPWASAKSCNNYLIPLRGIFEFEYQGGRALDNPMNAIQNMTLIKRIPDPLTIEERDLILADMAKHYDEQITAYFTFAFYTGMRPEEIIALQWGDIDWKENTVRIQRVRTFNGIDRDGSKTHSERDVDLVLRAITALHTMKKHTFKKSEYIFQDPRTGKPWVDERKQREWYWKPSLKRLGIRQRRAYATRHTFATTALMAGVNPTYIARQLGHASTKMLFDTYAKWIDGADKGVQRKAMERAMQ